ncbi:MAG: EamA family transporter [Thermoplasmata archaeon]|nr:EamA family transporter [Thermoplasmata archaeon]
MALEAAPAVLAVGAMLCLGLSDFLNKRAMSVGVRRTQFLVVQSVFFTLTTLVLLPLVGGFEWSYELWYAVACGAITFISYVFVLKALETGEASVAVPIYRMSFGITVILAVAFLGEEITPRKVLGFALIIIALIALTAINGRSKAEETYHSSDGLPLGKGGMLRTSAALAAAFAVVAMVTIGIKGFLYKVGVSEGAPPTTFALVQSLTFLPIAVTYALYYDRNLKMERKTWSTAPWNGVLTAMASLLLLAALIEGDASVAVPISQLCFVVTALLAVIVFRERLTPLKVAGIASAVIAVLVLSSTISIT